jgi:hypothetical protein
MQSFKAIIHDGKLLEIKLKGKGFTQKAFKRSSSAKDISIFY